MTMRKSVPYVGAYEARNLLRERKADVSSTFLDSFGNLNVFFLRKDDGRLYRTLLNEVWKKAFENEKLLPKEEKEKSE